ncbi:sigma-54 dependent transcriptional regulator [bacterium]|nr:sigma-54 dependent transcriptional regulator [bacterium]
MAKEEGKILIIDDDNEVRLSAKLFLKRHFSVVQTESDPTRIPSLMAQDTFDVILLDMNFTIGTTDGAEGIRWLNKILEISPGTHVIMITAYGHIEMAVKAIKEGAADFISKPWQNEKLLATVMSVYRLSRSRQEVQQLQSRQRVLSQVMDQPFTELIGDSPAMQKVYETIDKVARTDADVLILGENGTGKELVARAIHRRSKRVDEVFINVDLGAIAATLFESELFGHKKGSFTDANENRIGRFEAASDGTLFLDEIGNLSLPLQAKLLTVLQNREVVPVGENRPVSVDIRLVCATNMPLYEMVRENQFRQDLLYRINTVEVMLPPLRDRAEDVSLLARHFLASFARKYQKPGLRIAANTLKKLQKYHWPGNIRELRHALERATILSEDKALQPHDFRFHIEEKVDEAEETLLLEAVEKKIIKKALTRHTGNISRAAKELGITRAALYRRMEKHGL